MSGESRPTLLTFPTEYTFKLVGRNTQTFETEMLVLVRKHFKDFKEGAVKERPSAQKNFLAISVTVTVESQVQLDTFYQAINDHPLVVFAL